MLGNKSHANPASNAADPTKISEVCVAFGAGLVQLDGGINDPHKKVKKSFRWLILDVIKSRGEKMPLRHSRS